MSTKELLYSIIDELTEQQLLELICYLDSRKKRGKTVASVMGALSKYADPSLIQQEEGAWEREAARNYENP